MRKNHLLFPVLLFLFLPANARAADSIDQAFYFSDSVAGQEITIHGAFTDPGNRKVVLTSISPAGTSREAAATVPEAKDRLSFVIPTDLPSGRYRVIIRLIAEGGTQTDLPVPGELRIPTPPGLKVSVSKVRPISPYPNPAHANNYDFEIAGTNFAPDLANNHVEINGLPLDLKTGTDCGKEYKNPCLRVEPGSETNKLVVDGYKPPGFSHPLEVGVRVGSGDNVAKAADPLVFSSISKTRLQIYAVGAFFLLIGIVFALVQTGLRLRNGKNDKFSSLSAFLIDQDTNSYSLSKFQLVLFTLVTVFGYIYVFVCHLFVQWKFELPPVPEGLPTMMAVSVGTSVVAAGIGARIGGKGAGPESPSLADFITSGGIVLPERFQFFLWTIVSSGGVLALILASDPVTVTQLPKLPDGMLYLMGLSSAGYLGGKLVRGPGPSIKSVNAKKVDVEARPPEGKDEGEAAYTALEVTLTGDNLASDAAFELDKERIPTAQVKIISSTQESGQNAKLCSLLKVHFKNVAGRYLDGPHQLRIVNPDSQAAEISFGTSIESVGQVEGKPGTFSVKGSNFTDPSSAQWFSANSVEPRSIVENDVTKKSDTELVVTLPPDAVPARLSLISPGGLATTFNIADQKIVETPESPAIKSISPLKAGDESVMVTVRGTKLTEPLKAAWTNAAGARFDATVTTTSDADQLEIELKPGAAGTGKLELTSAAGLTTIDVTVEP